MSELWSTATEGSAEAAWLTLDDLEAAMAKVYDEGGVVHGTEKNPHVFHPRVRDGRNAICGYCGIDYFTLIGRHG